MKSEEVSEKKGQYENKTGEAQRRRRPITRAWATERE